jgi:hypothetical protein
MLSLCGRSAAAALVAACLAGPAVAQTAADVAAACAAAMSMPPGTCDCVGGRAEGELNDVQRQWYIHAANGDDDAAQALLPRMSVEEAAGAATFFRTSPIDCLRGQ